MSDAETSLGGECYRCGYDLRGLAKRARSAHLAEHCAIVGTGASATIFYVIAANVLFDNAKR